MLCMSKLSMQAVKMNRSTLQIDFEDIFGEVENLSIGRDGGVVAREFAEP